MPYIPSQPPADITQVDDLRKWVEEEFRRVARSLTVSDDVTFNIKYVAPAGPVEGMVVYADGTTWNPGAGKGTYEYRAGAWVKL